MIIQNDEHFVLKTCEQFDTFAGQLSSQVTGVELMVKKVYMIYVLTNVL